MIEIESIPIKHEVVDGIHFFTSEHRLAIGLCAANRDQDKAKRDVTLQLDVLMEKNYGIKHDSAPLWHIVN